MAVWTWLIFLTPNAPCGGICIYGVYIWYIWSVLYIWYMVYIWFIYVVYMYIWCVCVYVWYVYMYGVYMYIWYLYLYCFHFTLQRSAQLVPGADGEEVLRSRCRADGDAEVMGAISRHDVKLRK